MATSTTSLAMAIPQPKSPSFLLSPSSSSFACPLSSSVTPYGRLAGLPTQRVVVTAAAEEPASSVKTSQGEESDEEFEARLARLQRKVSSGSGKKAEKRKAMKAGEAASLSSSSSKGTVLLPPVPLLDPVSDGLRVELGFNSYTERLNGRFAALGLAALLLVELATGKSFFKYHEGAVIGIQAYFMLAVSAVFIKFEKEKISKWPKS